MRLGLGFGTRRGGACLGAFTTAPATEYLVLVEKAIAGTATRDEALILAWDAAGADSIDVVTPVGGVWSTTITLAVDALSVATTSEARTVYLIRQSTGQVIATLAVVARWATPNDIVDSVSGLRLTRGAWPCAKELGVVSVSSANVPADLNTWTSSAGVAISGAGPYTMLALVPSGRHWVYHATLTNGANSYLTYHGIFTAVGSQQWLRIEIRTGTWVNVDLLNGVTGNDANGCAALTVVNKVGSDVTVTIFDDTVAAHYVQIELLNGDAAGVPPNYAGSGSDGITIDYPSGKTCIVTQHRSSGVADQSLTVEGAERGADLLQATPAIQPLWGLDGWIDDVDGRVNGRPVAVSESGRAAYFETTNADVVGCASGDDPDFAAVFLGAIFGNLSCPWTWYGASSAAAVPLYVTGAELGWYRHDGATSSTKLWGSGLAAQFATPGFVAIIGVAGSLYLYRAGVHLATVVPGNLSTATMTFFRAYGRTHTSAALYGADTAVYAVDGTKTHAQIYAELRAAHARSISAFGVSA